MKFFGDQRHLHQLTSRWMMNAVHHKKDFQVMTGKLRILKVYSSLSVFSEILLIAVNHWLTRLVDFPSQFLIISDLASGYPGLKTLRSRDLAAIFDKIAIKLLAN
ncbi:hypothetical protein TIFTF001_015588 [Ficus carica]|uniref:Uncharacterized protein n=1 Tax=Ficus carica TaxID=3494 RepID=A0AA88D800_FICCA|nr:hypothetical protein TIFTF001_015588 [Ficus carica]